MNPDPSPSVHWSVRVIGSVILLFGFFLLAWVVIRNEPFADPVFAYAIRLFVALAGGCGAALLPGYFRYSLQGTPIPSKNLDEKQPALSGWGPLMFSVLVFFGTPYVTPSLDPDNVRRTPPERIPSKVWRADEYLDALTTVTSYQDRVTTERVQWVKWVLNSISRGDDARIERMMVVESEAFVHPYTGFGAVLETIPVKRQGTELVAFLVHGRGTGKTFTPLVTIYSPEFKQRVVYTPPSNKGDYLFLIMYMAGTEPLPKGERIDFQLHKL